MARLEGFKDPRIKLEIVRTARGSEKVHRFEPTSTRGGPKIGT